MFFLFGRMLSIRELGGAWEVIVFSDRQRGLSAHGNKSLVIAEVAPPVEASQGFMGCAVGLARPRDEYDERGQ